MYHYFIPFHGWIKFNHIDILPFVYWFTSWQTFTSFIHFDYYHSHSCSQPCQVPYPFSSFQFSHSVVSYYLQPMNRSTLGLPVHHQLPESTQTHVHRVGGHPTISSTVVPFSSCLQSLPASGSLPMSQLFVWAGQNIGLSASASILPMNIQDWSPLGWTGWISLQFKGLSRVFSNTTVQKHQFFSAQLSSQSNSHIHTWPLEKP